MTRHAVATPVAGTLRAVSLLSVLLGLSAAGALAQEPSLRLDEKEYFAKRGLDVLVFTNQYNGMFFDEKTAGIEMIHHGVRSATGGAVRLNPTPEQWDQIPKLVDRKVDAAGNSIEATLRYEAFDFESRVVVAPEGDGFRIAVFVDRPVPAALEGRAGLNLELRPSLYWEHTYLVDGQPRIFPRYPAGPTASLPAEKRIEQFEGHFTFDLHGHPDYVEALPVATGETLLLAPEDPERHVLIRSLSGELQLLDGRNLAQNGWFVVRSLLATKTTGKVAEWYVEPHTIPGWTREPVIGFSQVGYHPTQRSAPSSSWTLTTRRWRRRRWSSSGPTAGRFPGSRRPSCRGAATSATSTPSRTSPPSATAAFTSSGTATRGPGPFRSRPTSTSGCGTRPSTSSSRSRWTTCS